MWLNLKLRKEKQKRLLTPEKKEKDRKIGCVISFIILCIAMICLMVDFYTPEPLIPNLSKLIYGNEYDDRMFTEEFYIENDPILHPENKLSGAWFMMIFIMLFPFILNLIGYDKEGKKIDKKKIKKFLVYAKEYIINNGIHK